MIVVLGIFLMQWWAMKNQPPRPAQPEGRQEAVLDDKLVKPAASDTSDDPETVLAATEAEPAYVTLGSMDPESPYRMLVHLTNQGAALVRAELNTNAYRDVQDPTGYIGQIVVDVEAADAHGEGVPVQVLGPGTPAYRSGLAVGDIVTLVSRTVKATGAHETVKVEKFDDLRNFLRKTRPGESIDLTARRGDEDVAMTIALGHHPMNVIRPEAVPENYDQYREMGGLHGVVFQGDENRPRSDQLSFLTTLQKVDQAELDLPASLGANITKAKGLFQRDKTLDIELKDVELRREPWELVSQAEDEAVFRRVVPAWKLEMTKTYRLAKIEVPESGKSTPGSGYHLTLQVEVRNLDTKEHTVAYQLDGPTGLPLEGGWYARKTGPGWGLYGIRDLVVRFSGNKPATFSNEAICGGKVRHPWSESHIDYIGIDSLYFQCSLRSNHKEGDPAWMTRSMPIRVGRRNADWRILTDISYRLQSKPVVLQPGDGDDSRISHEYTVFLGPKDTRVLDEYELGQTISYGWFWFVAKPLLYILHGFHGLGLNYAMAIILLTICVRLLMFPISLKQAAGAAKMAVIQPKLQELAEKYGEDLQARSAAQRQLFKEHDYNPMAGCLPLLIQLPIFIGLYKALSIDAGLFGSPLISPAIRWCTDLSAPDMIFDWSGFWTWVGWPGFNMGQGALALGPYFNLLPMLTIALFLIQQKVMMPPPTDDQSRMQRNIMQYMMIFMGFLFFKVPSGLCVYFIVSTLWGLAERRFIPKPAEKKAAEQTYDVTPTGSSDKNAAEDRTKKRKRTRDQEAPKEEGFFARIMREAAEQNKFEKKDKPNKKKKKK